MKRVYEGLLFRLAVRSRIVFFKITPRPDITMEQGAEDMKRGMALLIAFATEPEVDGLVFDLRKPPRLPGPKSRDAIGRALEHWARAHRPVVHLIPADKPFIDMFSERLVETYTPELGFVTNRLSDAIAWVEKTRKNFETPTEVD